MTTQNPTPLCRHRHAFGDGNPMAEASARRALSTPSTLPTTLSRLARLLLMPAPLAL